MARSSRREESGGREKLALREGSTQGVERGQEGGQHRRPRLVAAEHDPDLPEQWWVEPHRGEPARPYVGLGGDRKSTRLNSSHVAISYAVFCLKKKKKRK